MRASAAEGIWIEQSPYFFLRKYSRNCASMNFSSSSNSLCSDSVNKSISLGRTTIESPDSKLACAYKYLSIHLALPKKSRATGKIIVDFQGAQKSLIFDTFASLLFLLFSRFICAHETFCMLTWWHFSGKTYSFERLGFSAEFMQNPHSEFHGNSFSTWALIAAGSSPPCQVRRGRNRMGYIFSLLSSKMMAAPLTRGRASSSCVRPVRM